MFLRRMFPAYGRSTRILMAKLKERTGIVGLDVVPIARELLMSLHTRSSLNGIEGNRDAIESFLNLPVSSPSNAALVAPPDLLKQLHNIVFVEIGSLDDMDSRLNHLGISIDPDVVADVVASADSTGTDASLLTTRRLLRFFSWSRRNGAESLSDTVFNHAIRVMAARKDFTALRLLISDLRRENREMNSETFALVSEALVKSGREVDAVRLFRSLDKHQEDRVISIIQSLCEKGHARKAEGVIWHHKEKLSAENKPDVYRHLVHGWCIHRDAREALRVLGEMKAEGIRPGLGSYNAYLRCVCDRNLRLNPSALVPEANVIMMEMRSAGVPPTAVSFNILLACLGRTRRVNEACEVLDSMVQGRAGCAPDWVSYYLVVRVLYLTGRFVRGNRIVDHMIECGLIPTPRFYHDLIGVLCGVESMDHAFQMFEKMKKWCTEGTGPTYDLLIAKLSRNGEFGTSRRLWDEAVKSGVVLHCSVDMLDPSKVEVFKLRTKREEAIPKDPKVAGRKEKKVIRKTSKDKRQKKACSA